MDQNNEWVIKGFIDVFNKIYSLTEDTKLISKVIELHLYPKLLVFSKKYGYDIILTDKQNWYPDITFILRSNTDVKFAVDLKTTYVTKFKNGKPYECNGFTLGSHGNYFINRNSSKNIQFPYSSYLGHFVLGILYERTKNLEPRVFELAELSDLPSVIKNFLFFVQEKWRIVK